MGATPLRSEEGEARDASTQAPAAAGGAGQLPPAALSLLSTINVATIISLGAAIFYFYDREYRVAYLRTLGIDAAAIPVAVPDAVVDGFLGVTINVLWLIVILTALAAAYVCVTWGVLRALQWLIGRDRWLAKPAAAHPILLDLGRNSGIKTAIAAFLMAFFVLITSLVPPLLVGIPAEQAGRKDAELAIRRSRGTGKSCFRFSKVDGERLLALPVASTSDRQFVLTNDDTLHVIKWDDLRSFVRQPVSCLGIGNP